jgi:hypothetical protein
MQKEQPTITETQETKSTEKFKLLVFDTNKYTIEELQEQYRLGSYELFKPVNYENTKPKEKLKQKIFTRPIRYFDGFIETKESTEITNNFANSWDNLSDYEDNLSILLKNDKVTEVKEKIEKPKQKLFDMLAEISKRERVVHINFNDHLLKLDFIPFEDHRDSEEDQNDQEDLSSSSESEIKDRRVCFLCEKPGHSLHQCLAAFEKCHLCGNKGHISKNCLMNSPQKARANDICRFCGKNGHSICQFNKFIDLVTYDSDASISDSDNEGYICTYKDNRKVKYLYNLTPVCSYCGGRHRRDACDESGFKEYTRDYNGFPSVVVQRMLEYEDFSD